MTTTDRAPADAATRPPLDADAVWRALDRASFAIVSHLTARGEPRSSGVLIRSLDRRLHAVIGAGSAKARAAERGGGFAVTVPVRRGGLLSLVLPIPPATVSFPATGVLHPAGDPATLALLERLGPLLPPERRATGTVLELRPHGTFLTYGIGVPLLAMRDPAVAEARVAVP